MYIKHASVGKPTTSMFIFELRCELMLGLGTGLGLG